MIQITAKLVPAGCLLNGPGILSYFFAKSRAGIAGFAIRPWY